MKTVLITNSQHTKALAITRSLGKKGVRVIAAEETRFTPTAFSKYCYKALVYPKIKDNPDKFYNWLVETIKKYNCDIIFPMDEDSLDIIMENYSFLSKICKIPLNPKAYFIARDKAKQVALAAEAGVDIPKTFELKTLDELEEISKKLDYPVIIKPKKSSGSRGVRVVESEEELLTTYRQINKEYPLPIIQDFMGLGQKYEVVLLFNEENENVAAYVQKLIRNFPVDIGTDVVQKSIYYPELTELALSIMKRLKWFGIVNIEFMVDTRDGKIKLLEINPRFWASTHSAMAAGIDFPWLLYKLSIGESIEKQYDYKNNMYFRNLLPGDILHFITNKNRREMDPPLLAGRKQGVFDDMISKEDFMPVIGFILACIRYLLDIRMWKFYFIR